MFDPRNFAYRCAFEGLYWSGLNRLLRPFVAGVGSIFMLHHVRSARPEEFQPNKYLEITPEFLESALLWLRRRKIDIVSMDEALRRLRERDFQRRFVVITLDDGYRDAKTCAYPVFKKYSVPFAIFVATSFPECRGQLWWVALESIIAANESITVAMEGQDVRLVCRTLREKYQVYLTLREWLASRPSEDAMLRIVRDLTVRYGIDMAAICASLCMTWDEIVELAADPLVTVGAHTVNHVLLSRAEEEVVRFELKSSRDMLEKKLGREVRHFAYPFGDARAAGPREFTMAAELGFETAVTTRPSVLFPGNCEHPTALPRITLSGEFQRERYFDVLASGTATAFWNGFRRLRAT